MPQFKSVSAAIRAIQNDILADRRRLQGAVRKTARATASYVRANVPRAFGELADSVHVVDVAAGVSDVLADAPHAAAVEMGYRPHMVPLEPLIAWVTLRGMQGLSATGRVRKSVVPSARSVATELRDSMGKQRAAAWRNSMSRLHKVSASAATNFAGLEADPEVVAVARRIQQAIAKRGTRPHRFMFAAVPEAERFLEQYAQEALAGRGGNE